MKDNFLLKKSQQAVFVALTDEDAGKLIKGIFDYVNTGNSNLDGLLNAVFIPIKEYIDQNEENYQKRCEKNKENVTRRWHQKGYEAIPDYTNVSNGTKNDTIVYDTIPNDTDNNHIPHITNHNSFKDRKKDNRGMGKEEKKKEKYGEYQNILLTKKEYESLQNAYSNYEELIKFLDEYIEEKGYKSKSHYLAMKRWVVQAVSEKDSKQSQMPKETPEWFGKKLDNAEMTKSEEEELDNLLKEIGG